LVYNQLCHFCFAVEAMGHINAMECTVKPPIALAEVFFNKRPGNPAAGLSATEGRSALFSPEFCFGI
jgi:hypothetical protein